MRLPVTAGPFQVHGVAHAVHAGPGDRVAQLERQLRHPEPPAAELQHLGHERERLQLAPLVERRQDLGLAAHLDDLADAQVEQLVRGDLLLSATRAPRVVDVDDRPSFVTCPGGVGPSRASATALRITSAAASGSRGAFSRWTPSRRTREVCGSAARCIASANARGSRGSTTIPLTPSCTIVPTAPVIGEITIGAPALSASTATRPTKSCSVGNTNAWQVSKAPLSASWSTVPRKVTSSSTPSRRGQLDQRVALRTIADDPERAWAELPPVGRQRSDQQVDPLLGDEPAGADEQRRSVAGPRAHGAAARRESAGKPASHQPTMILSSGR